MNIERGRAVIRDSIGWDVVNWSRGLAYWSAHTQVELEGGRGLEIGAQEWGGLSLWLASGGMRVVCSGMALDAQRMAAVHARHGVVDRIVYERIDALDIPYSEAFDVVAFKSVLGGIGRGEQFDLQRRAVAQMHQALRPGGELWFAENLRGARAHVELRNRYGAGRDHWRYLDLGELGELFEDFRSVRWTTAGFLGLAGRREWQRRALGVVDRAFDGVLVPQRFRYIVFGVASK